MLHIREPQPVRHSWWSYFTLGMAALFESASLFIALRQFKAQSGALAFWRALHQSKDPKDHTDVPRLEAAIEAIEGEVRRQFPKLTHISGAPRLANPRAALRALRA